MAAQSSVMTAPSPVTKATSAQGAYTKAPHVLPPAIKNQDGSTGSALREEMMRLYAVQEMNRRRLDELVTKVAETNQSPLTRDWSADTLCDIASAESPQKDTKPRPYQASVSDSTESEDEYDTVTNSAKPVPNAAPTTPRPSYTRSWATAPSSPVAIPQPASQRNHSAPSSPLPSPTSRPKVHFSDRNPVFLHNRASKSYYPQKTPAATTTADKDEPQVSPVDAKWGVLFNERGEPTRRMMDVLRGLAKYIITTYKPTNSLVVTPEKLYKFYTAFQQDREAINLTRFFVSSSREGMRNLETLYLDLQCEHHLVQDLPATGAKSRAFIPGLTPDGFVKWALFLIRSFPEQEAARLSAIVSALPLEAVSTDGGSERLPRQISRRLLPEKPHDDALRLLTQSVQYWCKATGGNSQRKESDATVSYRRSSHSREGRDDRERDRDRYRYRDVVVEVPSSRRRRDESSSPRDREQSRSSRYPLEGADDRSGRYYKSYRRESSPRRSKRYERDGRDDGGGSGRRRRWTLDGSEAGRMPSRRRESRSGR